MKKLLISAIAILSTIQVVKAQEPPLTKFEIEAAYQSGNYYVIKLKDIAELHQNPYFYGTLSQLRQVIGREYTGKELGLDETRRGLKFARKDKDAGILVLSQGNKKPELRCDGKTKFMYEIASSNYSEIEDNIQAGNINMLFMPTGVEEVYYTADMMQWIQTIDSSFYMTPKKGSNTYGFRLFSGNRGIGGLELSLNEQTVVSADLNRDGGSRVYRMKDGSSFHVPAPRNKNTEETYFMSADGKKTIYMTYEQIAAQPRESRKKVRLAYITGGGESLGSWQQTRTPCDFIDLIAPVQTTKPQETTRHTTPMDFPK